MTLDICLYSTYIDRVVGAIIPLKIVENQDGTVIVDRYRIIPCGAISS